jgi:hypothetical protein
MQRKHSFAHKPQPVPHFRACIGKAANFGKRRNKACFDLRIKQSTTALFPQLETYIPKKKRPVMLAITCEWLHHDPTFHFREKRNLCV